MSQITRRDFLATSSLAVTSGAIGRRGDVGTLVVSPLPRRGMAAAFMPEAMEASDLQRLAMVALDAIRDSRVTYADVRVAERHEMVLQQTTADPLLPQIRLDVSFTYGVRVLVDGQWGFAHGTKPDVDTIAKTARHAVATTRTYGRVSSSRMSRTELIPAPVVTGTWDAPMSIDPFGVPIEDQIALLWACQQAMARVPGADVHLGGGSLNWIRQRRAFASTDGSSVVQTVYRSYPYFGALGERGTGGVQLKLPQPSATTGGYESVLLPDLQDRIKVIAEDAVRLARLPRRPAEVGRYPIVFDGACLGSVLNATLGQALELDRVLGDEADASGGSFLGPVMDVLGKPLFSPLLTVAAGSVLPSAPAVKWDDDGVETHSYPLITSGRVMDYHTSRQTAPALAEWYQRQGQSVRSNGCASAPDAGDVVLVRTPHLTMASGTTPMTLDDLCRDIHHGFLAHGWVNVTTDQQLTSGMGMGQIFEIERGKIVHRVRDAAIQFTTSRLWQSLAALGDATTVVSSEQTPPKGQPWVYARQSTTAPAGLVKDVDVISLALRHV